MGRYSPPRLMEVRWLRTARIIKLYAGCPRDCQPVLDALADILARRGYRVSAGRVTLRRRAPPAAAPAGATDYACDKAREIRWFPCEVDYYTGGRR